MYRATSTKTTHQNWLDEIQGGDTIQLLPRAVFPAWVSFVAEATIEVWYEVVPLECNAQLSSALSMNLSNKVTYTSYGNLDSSRQQIRVPKLEPEQVEYRSILRLSLQYQELDDGGRPPYEALSYC